MKKAWISAVVLGLGAGAGAAQLPPPSMGDSVQTAPAAAAPARLIPDAPPPAPAPQVPAPQAPAPQAPALQAAAPAAKPPTRDQLAEAYLDYLRKAGTDGDKRMSEIFLKDLNAYLAAYRDEAGADEVLGLRAGAHQRSKDYAAAAVDWLKLIYEYPDSRFAQDAKSALAELAQGRLKKDGEVLTKLALGPKDAPRAERFAQLLQGAGELKNDAFASPLRTEYAEFMARYPEQAGADKVELLAAKNEVLAGEESAAVYGYKKLLALYQDSALRPQALLGLGDLYYRRLRDYEQALGAYAELTARHADSAQAVEGFQRVSELQERARKYPDAVAALEEVVKRAPGQDPALKALGSIAKLYRDRMSMFDQSIKAYERLAEMFRGDAGVAALSDAAYEAGRELKDYPRQIALLGKIAAEYPERAEAPEAMYQQGGIYEDYVNDLDKAAGVYADLAAKFPDSKYAKKAQGRIEKIRKKQAQQQSAK